MGRSLNGNQSMTGYGRSPVRTASSVRSLTVRKTGRPWWYFEVNGPALGLLLVGSVVMCWAIVREVVDGRFGVFSFLVILWMSLVLLMVLASARWRRRQR